jgi:hypothetical protein
MYGGRFTLEPLRAFDHWIVIVVAMTDYPHPWIDTLGVLYPIEFNE